LALEISFCFPLCLRWLHPPPHTHHTHRQFSRRQRRLSRRLSELSHRPGEVDRRDNHVHDFCDDDNRPGEISLPLSCPHRNRTTPPLIRILTIKVECVLLAISWQLRTIDSISEHSHLCVCVFYQDWAKL
jgi:hypothetical protein